MTREEMSTTSFDRSTSNRILPAGQREHWYNADAFSEQDAWAGRRRPATAVVLVDLVS